MKTSLRLALLACASAIGLAYAAPSLASYGPSLTVEQSSYKLGAATTLDFFVAGSQADDPTAKLMLSSPAGYGVNLSHPLGTKLGKAVAVVVAGQLGGALIPLAGDVVVGNPSDPAISAASAKCTGLPISQAVLVLNMKVAGQTQTVPFLVFVNKVGAQAIFQVCVPYPDNAPFGAKVILLDATIKSLFTNPTTKNGYEWSSLFTPYSTVTKTANPAGTLEWRTYVGLPQSLTFKRVKSKPSLVSFAGALKIEGLDPKNIKLHLYAGKKAGPAPNTSSGGSGKLVAKTRKLKSNGKYTITRPRVKVRTFFQMRFEGYITQCPAPSPAPMGCQGEDLAPMTSSQVRVAPPPRRR